MAIRTIRQGSGPPWCMLGGVPQKMETGIDFIPCERGGVVMERGLSLHCLFYIYYVSSLLKKI